MMKKLLILLLALLCACAIAEAENAPLAPVTPVIELEGNPSTGYTWNWDVLSDGEVIAVSGDYIVNWQPQHENDLLPPGTGGHYRITLTGLKPGEATITFTYARAWENTAPLYALVYRVSVDAQGSVTILSVSFEANPSPLIGA